MAEKNQLKRIYPFKIRPVHAETSRRHAAMFSGHPSGLVSANHWGLKLLGTCTEEELTAAHNASLDPKDIWLVTPPKCGSIWNLEMIWLLANDLDYSGAQTPLLPDRCTFRDVAFVRDKNCLKTFEEKVQQGKPHFLEEKPNIRENKISKLSPRFFMTHLPFSVNNPDLLDTCKVFFVARNIKDVCLSYYKFTRMIRSQGFCGNLREFADMFMSGETLFSPFISMVEEAWNLRHHPNMCVLFYEDAKKDLFGYLKTMAKFLGKSFLDEEIVKLENHLHIDNFRKNPYVNQEGMFSKVVHDTNEQGSFIRKGEVGDWYNHCTPEMDSKFDTWIKEQLRGVDPALAKKLWLQL